MNILITGSSGFIGRNLSEALLRRRETEVLPFNSKSDPALLEQYTGQCDFVYHLAAVHRPQDERDFELVNHQLLERLLNLLRRQQNRCPVLLASSIHTGKTSGYGRSKLAAEKALQEHARKSGARAIIYRLTNTFGRYARPYGHSVVATFCHSIARGLPVEISDPGGIINFYYIDDVIDSFLKQLEGDPGADCDGFYRLPPDQKYAVTLQGLADRLYCFEAELQQGREPRPGDRFSEKLYRTYLSYRPTELN